MKDNAFNQGRAVLSAPLLAIGAIGIVFDALSLAGTTVGLMVIAANVCAVILGIRIMTDGTRAFAVASSVAILVLAATPWITTYPLSQGVLLDQLAPGMTASGYALIAIALWCQPWQFIAGLAIWASGMILLIVYAPADERQFLLVGLVNCLVIVPVVVIVASIAARRFRQTQIHLTLQRDAMNAEIVRANAASVIDGQLTACIARTESLIAAIADGAELDDVTRHELSCLEGLIRATIQIDPVTGGAFARTAGQLCNTAFSHAIPAQVGVLASSPDNTPLPSALVQVLESTICLAETITIRTIRTGDKDFLSLRLYGEKIKLQDHELFTAEKFENLSVEIERNSANDTMILVGRLIQK